MHPYCPFFILLIGLGSATKDENKVSRLGQQLTDIKVLVCLIALEVTDLG